MFVGAEEFTAFYGRHYRLILTVAQQRLRGLSDAEDATAEVFRIAWAHHQSGGDLTLPWTYQVLRNVIGTEYRRAARTQDLYTRIAPTLAEEIVAPISEDAVSMQQSLYELPEPDREIIAMAYWEDLTSSEIAAILGCSSTAARLRLMRAKRKLRAVLDRERTHLQMSEEGER